MTQREDQAAGGGPPQGGRRRPTPARLLRRLPLLPLLPLCLGVVVGGVGCDLDDVTVNLGDPIVIVHAIMRPDQPQQYVVVERSFTGDSLGFSDGEPIPRDIPQRPIAGATVTVRNLDFPTDPCGTALFDRTPVNRSFFALPGIYWGPAGCPTMRLGDRLELTVETREGKIITGRAVVPQLSGGSVTASGVARAFGSDTMVFNRDIDTVGIAVEASFFRAMQVEVRRARTPFEPGSSAQDVTLLTFVDSNAVRLPGDVKDLFIRGDGGDTFIPGRYATLTVGVADSNYYDFVRTETNEFTGRGLLNRLVGGIGVFGAVAVATHRIKVVADQDDPREGFYRLQGAVEGVDVDLTLDVFLPRSIPSTPFAAFAEGTWVQRQAVGAEWAPLPVAGASVEGQFTGDDLMVRIPCPPTNCLIGRWVLRGSAAAPSFGVAVWDSSGIQSQFRGEVIATRP